MRVYKNGDIDIPRNLNLTELLHTTARSDLKGDHLISKDSLTGREITLDGLRDRAGRLAAGFKDAFQPVDQSRWALIIPNSVNYVEIFHSVLWLGGVCCPINHVLKPAEIAHAIVVSRPHFVAVYEPVLQSILQAVDLALSRAKAEGLEFTTPRIITVLGNSKDFPDVERYLRQRRLDVPHYEDTKSRLASIHLSSGTTGNPKGVALSHFNYVANVSQLFQHAPDNWNSNVRIVSYTPFVHIANTTIPLFLGPWTGMLHCIMPSYNVDKFGQMVQDNKANYVQAVASVALSIANTDLTQRYDFSTVRYLVAGGLPMQEETYRRLLSRGNWQPLCLYGMTEAAPYVAFQRVTEKLPLGKIGTLLPGIEAVLRIEDGTKDAPEGAPGEMWLRGPNMTSGYVFNEEATKAAFKGDGWYNTGDVCTFSPEGYFQIVGRTKELVKYKGFQVSPTELESYINAHPDVVEAAVGGVWDAEQLTELPTAYVVLREHVNSQQKKVQVLRDIRSIVDAQVSGYKKLRGGVWEVLVLPKNANTKILRKQLPDQKTGVSDLTKAGNSLKL
ncbi:AMP-binding enzyme [Rhizodiscina lignyota]|uniref:AMP-binding enzyme n=1 Tax=Rhizodiscina lignyota TaxID=1504668 RepID=A0A9P4I2G2_9PEZI|nr:AMP-binding enzyme [Rhizodiscina lignyota]